MNDDEIRGVMFDAFVVGTDTTAKRLKRFLKVTQPDRRPLKIEIL
ncbi:62_t:CDS:2 [Paraglomus brasilianum]|uniref:62_t:CDS:1 n=1 Tax=Paraglomus brasilianum TaxID=144538 RepID=A0A9N9DNN8_9GLOM|nr:62_t:CDS:2 [Paraglomus brasilianum]